MTTRPRPARPSPVARRAARWVGVRAVAAARDAGSLVAHGTRGPRAFERLWLDPAACGERIVGFDELRSGRVVGGDWDRDNAPTAELPKVAACLRHWRDGVAWEDTGIYEHLLERIRRHGRPLYGCRTRDDLCRRYERLDAVFEQVRSEGRLRTRPEVAPGTLRERGGIVVHVGRDTRPIFAKEGCHRLAMAQALALPVIPAQLGVLHPGALGAWRDAYREGVAAGGGLPRQP